MRMVSVSVKKSIKISPTETLEIGLEQGGQAHGTLEEIESVQDMLFTDVSVWVNKKIESEKIKK